MIVASLVTVGCKRIHGCNTLVHYDIRTGQPRCVVGVAHHPTPFMVTTLHCGIHHARCTCVIQDEFPTLSQKQAKLAFGRCVTMLMHACLSWCGAQRDARSSLFLIDRLGPLTMMAPALCKAYI